LGTEVHQRGEAGGPGWLDHQPQLIGTATEPRRKAGRRPR
jgi:hypothetical protein